MKGVALAQNERLTTARRALATHRSENHGQHIINNGNRA